MKLHFLFFTLIFFSIIANAQDWKFYEKTYLKGSISGSITKGYLFKTSGATFFEIIEYTRQRVRVRNPEVTIYNDGNNYKLDIEDFDEPVICRKVKSVIESAIDGEFKGWDGSTIFKLKNGQIWQQSEYSYKYHYAYQPSVIIYESKYGFKMKVENVDDVISVMKLK